MGVFGQVELIIECESSEVADKIEDNLEEKVKEYIKENTDHKEFHLSFDGIDGGDTCIIVNISSGRVQNAEWQGEMVKDFLVENHKKDIVSVMGEVITPDNYLYWSKDEE